MENAEKKDSNITLLFAEVAKKVGVYLVIMLFFNGFVGYMRYSELEGPLKHFAFNNGDFFVNDEVVGVPFFSLVNFVLFTAALGSAVLNWTRKVKS